MQRQVRRRLEKNEKKREKPFTSKPIDKKWFWIIGGAVALVIAVISSVWAYSHHDRVVASVDGLNIRASELGFEMFQAEAELSGEYFAMFQGET